MSGTKAGGLKARQTNLKKYGKDFYRNIGHIGGTTPGRRPGGFAANPERAKLAGAKGGRNGKRGMSKDTPAKVAQIKDLLKKRASVEVIARNLGLAPTTIKHYISRYNMEVKK